LLFIRLLLCIMAGNFDLSKYLYVIYAILAVSILYLVWWYKTKWGMRKTTRVEVEDMIRDLRMGQLPQDLSTVTLYDLGEIVPRGMFSTTNLYTVLQSAQTLEIYTALLDIIRGDVMFGEYAVLVLLRLVEAFEKDVPNDVATNGVEIASLIAKAMSRINNGILRGIISRDVDIRLPRITAAILSQQTKLRLPESIGSDIVAVFNQV